MIWIVYIVAGLVGVVVAIAAIGMLLPRDHVATRSRTFSRPPDEVWRAVTDLEAMPAWRSGVTKVEMLSPTSFREHGKHGAVTYAIEDDRAGHRVNRIADTGLPYGGLWRFELAGSTLTITEEGFVTNPIFRFMSNTVFSPTKSLERFLADLAKHLA